MHGKGLLTGLVVSLLLVTGVHAAEVTQVEKLCAGYAKKKAMLEKRQRRGMHGWERPKIKAQLDKIAEDSSKFCPKAPVAPGVASSPTAAVAGKP